MAIQLRKATRKQAKMRLGLSAVSGAGKTYSALLMAKGLVGDWDKVAVIDTENGSADLYSHLGEFNVVTLFDFSPEGYVEAIKACENAGMECIIIDSITQEWDYCLELQSKLGGNYQSWARVTPRHEVFKKAILSSSCHIFTTVRRKQDYDMTKDANGKLKVEKAGLKEETRSGWEYELTVNLALDVTHFATAEKDRTGLFMDKPSFIPSEKTGEMIKNWCNMGTPVQENEVKSQELLSRASSCSTMEELNTVVLDYPDYKSYDKSVSDALNEIAKRIKETNKPQTIE